MDEKIKIEFNPSINKLLECEKIEFELVDLNDELDLEILSLQDDISNLDIFIDKMTDHSDKLDVSISVFSGLLTGIIDMFFVGEFSLKEGYEWSSNKVNDFVKKVARITGYKGNDLEKAIRHLEKYGSPSDSVTSSFGGGRQHHLRDFAHHASPIGLIFSLLTQFTGKAYGTNEFGAFISVDIEKTAFIGHDFSTKIIFGLIYWIFHMASDMAGSNSYAGTGTGVTGPILSLVKTLSSIRIFKDKNAASEFSSNLSKLFNGTLLAERDEKGKIAKDSYGKPLVNKMDLRGELGVFHQITKQAIPILINESLVRGFFFINRFIEEIKVKKKLKYVDWEKTYPFENRTIERMLTISNSVFTMIDLSSAFLSSIIHYKGSLIEIGKEFILKINFVGVGRLAISIGNETIMNMRKNKIIKERMELNNELLYLMKTKIIIGEKNIWVAAEETEKSIAKLLTIIEKTKIIIDNDISEIYLDIDEIEDINLSKIEENNFGLIDELLDILE